MKPERVRIADKSDEEELMAICRELHQENGLFAMNEDKVRDMLYRSFDRQGGIVGVIGAPGGIEGLICMIMSTFWYSNDPHWEELFSFVLPQYRRSTNAKDLIEFAKWCADGTGFPLVIGILSNERTESKVRLYQRQLDKPIGAFFKYTPQKALQAAE